MTAGAEDRERLLSGLPLVETRVDFAGTTTRLLEGGAGPPLILLQGGIECGGVYWGPVVRDLADAHRLIVPDLPGLGESEPFGRLDQDAFSSWLRALVESRCDAPPPLVAHSLNGSLAARFAARHHGVLERLAIYGAPGVGPYRMPIGLRMVALRFALRPTAANAERFDRWAFFDFERFRRAEPRWLEAFSGYTRARAAVPHVKRTMRALVKLGTRRIPDEELARIEIPAVLLWGRHDRFVPVAVGETAAATMGWPLHAIDDAGHVPHIEWPRAFAETLRVALRGADAGRRRGHPRGFVDLAPGGGAKSTTPVRGQGFRP